MWESSWTWAIYQDPRYQKGIWILDLVLEAMKDFNLGQFLISEDLSNAWSPLNSSVTLSDRRLGQFHIQGTLNTGKTNLISR